MPVVQTQTVTSTNEQEIPDNVTAELEKLEQETGKLVYCRIRNDLTSA